MARDRCLNSAGPGVTSVRFPSHQASWLRVFRESCPFAGNVSVWKKKKLFFSNKISLPYFILFFECDFFRLSPSRQIKLSKFSDARVWFPGVVSRRACFNERGLTARQKARGGHFRELSLAPSGEGRGSRLLEGRQTMKSPVRLKARQNAARENRRSYR